MNLDAYVILGYSFMIVAASLLGGWLPTRFRLSHTRLQVILSFVGGLMLGIGLLHLLPHAIVQSGSIDLAIQWTLYGLVFMFILIRIFHFHQHGTDASSHESAHDDCGHDHSHQHHHEHGSIHGLSWLGVAVGLAVHTLIDGIALGAAVKSDMTSGSSLWGVGVFFAIALHKPLDALSITTLMAASGWSPRAQNVVNACFALMCPVGALCFTLGIDASSPHIPTILGMALGFSAGSFLCISLSDLLPEVQFHRHDRLKLSVALLSGIATAYGIGLMEPSHAHSLPSLQPTPVTSGHDEPSRSHASPRKPPST